MHHPQAKGHTAKHAASKKHHPTSKHHPKHHKHPHHHHKHHTKQHAHGKAAQAQKARQLSYGISCSLEALADTAPFYVTDADIAALYDTTRKTNQGVFICDALEAASKYGLAGRYPVFRESEYITPGCIVGMTLPEGSHAAVLTDCGIYTWGNDFPWTDRYLDYIEEAWEVAWL